MAWVRLDKAATSPNVGANMAGEGRCLPFGGVFQGESVSIAEKPALSPTTNLFRSIPRINDFANPDEGADLEKSIPAWAPPSRLPGPGVVAQTCSVSVSVPGYWRLSCCFVWSCQSSRLIILAFQELCAHGRKKCPFSPTTDLFRPIPVITDFAKHDKQMDS